MKILIADDDPDDIDLFEEALNAIYPQYNLCKATNGLELFKILETGVNPDLIVLHSNMPLISGLQCIKDIRANPEWAKMQVAILTTSTRSVDVEECMLNGADHYFIKPYSFEGLKEVIIKMLKKV